MVVTAGEHQLSEQEQKLLYRCESDIQNGFALMFEGFKTIKERALWRGSHTSFQSYLMDKWDMRQSRVSQFIKAFEVLDDLTDFDQKPTNESQCRPLSSLDSDERQEVWETVLESGEKPTTALIQQTVMDLKGDEDETEPDGGNEVVTVFTSAVNALDYVCRSIAQTGVRERVDELQVFVNQSRTKLDHIESSILPLRVEVQQ